MKEELGQERRENRLVGESEIKRSDCVSSKGYDGFYLDILVTFEVTNSCQHLVPHQSQSTDFDEKVQKSSSRLG